MRVRRRIALALLALCGASAALLATPVEARAHPLGNFTVNRYAGIEVAGSDVYVRYALDLAEIPTVQLGAQVRGPGYASVLARDLVLTLDGRRVPLRVVERRVASRPGAGGLETLRLEERARRSAFATSPSPGGSAGAR
jgi:nickel/cobalt exporter